MSAAMVITDRFGQRPMSSDMTYSSSHPGVVTNAVVASKATFAMNVAAGASEVLIGAMTFWQAAGEDLRRGQSQPRG